MDKDQKVRQRRRTRARTKRPRWSQGESGGKPERAAAGLLSHENYLFDSCEKDVCDGLGVRASQREIPARNKVGEIEVSTCWVCWDWS